MWVMHSPVRLEAPRAGLSFEEWGLLGGSMARGCVLLVALEKQSLFKLEMRLYHMHDENTHRYMHICK